MCEVLDIAKALADRNRLRILMALTGGELCVCQIIELLGLAPSTVSKHAYILRQAGLVDARKDGRWVHYRLVSREATKIAGAAIKWVGSGLADDNYIRKDAERLKAILKIDPEEICRKQTRR